MVELGVKFLSVQMYMYFLMVHMLTFKDGATICTCNAAAANQIVFRKQPGNVTIKEGEKAYFPCVYDGTTARPIWNITQCAATNGTYYSNSLPTNHYFDGTGLKVTVTSDMNSCSYSCFFLLSSGGTLWSSVGVLKLSNDSGPDDNTLVEGTRDILIPCELLRSYAHFATPSWRISGIAYDPYDLPLLLDDQYPYKAVQDGLLIGRIHPLMNGTTYQCYVVNQMGVSINSTVGRLTVLEASNFDNDRSNVTEDAIIIAKLHLDHDNIRFGHGDGHTLAWMFDTNHSCVEKFNSTLLTLDCQGNELASNTTTGMSTNVTLNDLVHNGHSLFIRIKSGVDIPCAMTEQEIQIQHLLVSEKVTVTPGADVCIEIPLQDLSPPAVIWPTEPGSTDYCLCPYDPESAHLQCRSETCNTQYEVSWNITVPSNPKFCLLNITTAMNETSVFIKKNFHGCANGDGENMMKMYSKYTATYQINVDSNDPSQCPTCVTVTEETSNGTSDLQLVLGILLSLISFALLIIIGLISAITWKARNRWKSHYTFDSQKPDGDHPHSQAVPDIHNTTVKKHNNITYYDRDV